MNEVRFNVASYKFVWIPFSYFSWWFHFSIPKGTLKNWKTNEIRMIVKWSDGRKNQFEIGILFMLQIEQKLLLYLLLSEQFCVRVYIYLKSGDRDNLETNKVTGIE